MPSLSTTAETQGALQRGATGESETEMGPKVSRRCAAAFQASQRRSGRTLRRRSALPLRIRERKSGRAPAPLGSDVARSKCWRRLNASDDTSAARNETRLQSQSASGFHGGAQMAAVAALNGGAAGHREVADSFDAARLRQRPADQRLPARGESHREFRGGPSKRHDHVIQAFDDLVRIAFDQQSRAQQGSANLPLSQKTA